jgi:ZIP family zinc transporter
MTISQIFITASLAALATGLGAVPFLFVPDISKKWFSTFYAISAGLLLGASFGLVSESQVFYQPHVFLGMVIGIFSMGVLHNALENRTDLKLGAIQGSSGIKALIILGALTIHAFADGISIGVSYAGSETLGDLITTAIAFHNIPVGLAICAVLIPQGVKPYKAAGLSILASLPQPLISVPAFFFVTALAPLLPIGIGFAAGSLVWVVFAELITEAIENISHNRASIIIGLSFIAMLAFQAFVIGG